MQNGKNKNDKKADTAKIAVIEEKLQFFSLICNCNIR